MKFNTKSIIRGGLLIAVAIVLQLIGRNIPQINQIVVGSGINAVLLIATFMCGTYIGVAIGILTPLTALLVGQLNPALAPFIPFIMVGNAIFVVTFGILYNRFKINIFADVICGALLKFRFLYIAALKLVDLFKINFPPKVAKTLVVAMGTPQLITALIGGTIAIIIIKLFKSRNFEV